MTDTRYRGRHRASRRVALAPSLVGAGLVVPTTATLAIVSVNSGASATVDLGADNLVAGRAPLDASAADTAELAGRKSSDAQTQSLARGAADRAARTSERSRLDAVTAENQRRAAAEAALAAGEAVVEVSPTGADDSEEAPPTTTGPRAWVKPVNASYVLTSGFTWRWGSFHKGQDLAMPTGTPVKALSSGVVTFVGWSGSYGNKVDITYWDGTVSYYAHLSRIKVREGDKVVPGQVVALSGNTGRSTGPHLHLEIHPGAGAAVNPMTWLRNHGIRL